MIWIIFIILLLICTVSEYIQHQKHINNKVRTSFYICIFIYHSLSVYSSYMYDNNDANYSASYWVGFFLPGIIMTIIEIYFLVKSLKNKEDS